MKANLKLVPPKSKLVKGAFGPRPISVFYSGGGHPGYCKSVRSAVVSATRRLLAEDTLQRANIVHQGGILADLDKVFGKITITWQTRQVKNLW